MDEKLIIKDCGNEVHIRNHRERMRRFDELSVRIKRIEEKLGIGEKDYLKEKKDGK